MCVTVFTGGMQPSGRGQRTAGVHEDMTLPWDLKIHINSAERAGENILEERTGCAQPWQPREHRVSRPMGLSTKQEAGLCAGPGRQGWRSWQRQFNPGCGGHVTEFAFQVKEAFEGFKRGSDMV